MNSRIHRLTVRTTLVAAVALSFGLAGAAPAAQAHDEGRGEVTQSRPSTLSQQARHRLHLLEESLQRFRDPAAAVAAGWVPSVDCVDLPDHSAAMGIHYVNPVLMASTPDWRTPPILVYVPARDGGLRLGAVEWFAADADQDLATDADRPSLLGVPFDGPMPGHSPGMPVHYDLHAWIFVDNPAGVTAPFNPRVHC